MRTMRMGVEKSFIRASRALRESEVSKSLLEYPSTPEENAAK